MSVRGAAIASWPSRRHSWQIPSFPLLFFLHILFIIFCTFFTVTCLRLNFRFLFFTFSVIRSSGSLIWFMSTLDLSVFIFSTKKLLNAAATSVSSKVSPSADLIVIFCVEYGLRWGQSFKNLQLRMNLQTQSPA